MQISITADELRKRSIFLATPMYGGACAGMYCRSVAELTATCVRHGIDLKQFFLFNESLITRARNYCVDEFLRSGATHLLFIDSDIGFAADDVLTMLALQSDDSPYDVLCAPYPKKCISWEKIKEAVNRGFADNNPNTLENFVGDYVFNPAPNNNGSIPLNEPAEVLESGTGFMMIKRSVFEAYDKAYPTQRYKPDHVRSDNFDGSREIMAYFDCIIDPETKRYLSEDYMFCQNVRKAGGKVWLCPWMQTKHVGSYIFGGSLADIAAIGANPTADPSKLKK
jgi:hypothetical protein